MGLFLPLVDYVVVPSGIDFGVDSSTIVVDPYTSVSGSFLPMQVYLHNRDLYNTTAGPLYTPDVQPVLGDGGVLQEHSSSIADIWAVLATLSGSGGSNVFGSEFHEASSEPESSTTSTDYTQKLRLVTSTVPQGKYRIGWQFGWKRGSTDSDFEARVQIDDTTTLMEMNVETKDSSNWGVEHGFYITQLTAGSYYIDLDYAGETNKANKTSYIRRARIEIWRVE